MTNEQILPERRQTDGFLLSVSVHPSVSLEVFVGSSLRSPRAARTPMSRRRLPRAPQGKGQERVGLNFSPSATHALTLLKERVRAWVPGRRHKKLKNSNRILTFPFPFGTTTSKRLSTSQRIERERAFGSWPQASVGQGKVGSPEGVFSNQPPVPLPKASHKLRSVFSTRVYGRGLLEK